MMRQLAITSFTMLLNTTTIALYGQSWAMSFENQYVPHWFTTTLHILFMYIMHAGQARTKHMKVYLRSINNLCKEYNGMHLTDGTCRCLYLKSNMLTNNASTLKVFSLVVIIIGKSIYSNLLLCHILHVFTAYFHPTQLMDQCSLMHKHLDSSHCKWYKDSHSSSCWALPDSVQVYSNFCSQQQSKILIEMYRAKALPSILFFHTHYHNVYNHACLNSVCNLSPCMCYW